VLVVAAENLGRRLAQHGPRAVPVGVALAEVDGAGVGGQPRHGGENRFAQRAQPLDRAVVAVVAACGVGALFGHASDDTARWRPVARCPGTMFRMSDPVSGFDAGPDCDPTDHGFTPVTPEEGRLRQLVEYLEEHVPAFTDTVAIPWEGTAEEVAAARSKANDCAARMPDYIVHTS